MMLSFIFDQGPWFRRLEGKNNTVDADLALLHMGHGCMQVCCRFCFSKRETDNRSASEPAKTGHEPWLYAKAVVGFVFPRERPTTGTPLNQQKQGAFHASILHVSRQRQRTSKAPSRHSA
jgi:hypothetical protein